MAYSSSRLYHQLTSSFLLLNRSSSITNSSRISLISPPPQLLKSPSLRFYSGRISVVVTANDDASLSSSAAAASAAHPWPEWGQLVDKMRSKGYFVKKQAAAATGAGEDATDVSSSSYSSSSMELNEVKNACLAFARERYDILRSLPKEDIQTMVECGCPNLFRKTVNSAKRLRAFLRLDEGDVCGACNMRGSCDRAYVIENVDAQARTVDVMRILMSYAEDPALNSGGTNPSMTEHVQDSARKLLGELIRLSDTTIDPTLPKPEVQSTSKKEPSEKSEKVIRKSNHSRDIEMKKGDWVCSNCNFLNFARNVRCLECKADGPKRVEFSSTEMKLGDWTCPKCEFMNFARNKKCFRCNELRPKRELNPGEWECPRCDFVNFRRNTVCKKCNCERPDDDKASGWDDHAWINPRMTKDNNKVLDFGDDENEDEEEDCGDERR